MTLSEWVRREGGRAAVAKKLGVTKQAVGYWLRGENIPRADTLLKIFELSRGKVYIQGIIFNGLKNGGGNA